LSESSTTIIEAQPDWITATVGGKYRSRALRDLAEVLAEQEAALGNKLGKWTTHSYQGERMGRVAYGETPDDKAIIQLSGDFAAQHLRAVLPLVDTVTRIDLAVTVRTPERDPTVAENAFYFAADWYDEHPRSAAPWRIQHKKRGDTTYVGSRNTDTFLRIYDKQAECEGHHDDRNAERYQNCWRYELELKGKTTSIIALAADRATDPAAHVRGAITHYLHRHGIPPVYTDHSPCVILPGFTRRSDAESKLYNLGRNVRPSLDWLRDAGYADDAMAMLGIGVTAYAP
jgi:hypothetical protein